MIKWLWEWLYTYKRQSIKSGTVQMYIGIINIIDRWEHATDSLLNINERLLQRFLNSLQQTSGKPYSKSIMKKVRNPLRQAYVVAKQQKMIPYNPCNDLTAGANQESVALNARGARTIGECVCV